MRRLPWGQRRHPRGDRVRAWSVAAAPPFPPGASGRPLPASRLGPHYLVCNADESEPGTFKDRVIIEGDPFSLDGSNDHLRLRHRLRARFVYLRGEYPRVARTPAARHRHVRARADTWAPTSMNHGFDFEIEIVRGAGAYICGEETAIFNSIEGYRGEPRSKPPFPVEVGLFGKPTVVNNVETLVNVLPIVLNGGPAYAAIGTAGSTGTKVFCVSGNVAAPGVYEVSVRRHAARDDRACRWSTRWSHAAKRCCSAAPLVHSCAPTKSTFPSRWKAPGQHGTTLGSGVVMVLDDTVDMPHVPAAHRRVLP